MNNKLYKLMDWPKIEAVVYSESDCPHEAMGPRKVGNHTLLQTFQPGAQKVEVVIKGEKTGHAMTMADEEGYFVGLVPGIQTGRSVTRYVYRVTDADGEVTEVKDAYAFLPQLEEGDLDRFTAGLHYTVYQHLGAHPMTVGGSKGVNFAVWAPNAVRVSVVGDFNHWDGRVHQMSRRGDSGVFEIFLPDVKEGDYYKFELKIKDGLTYLKADPYAFGQQLRPETASVVRNMKGFGWDDKEWLAIRKAKQAPTAPVSIYELYLGSFRRQNKEASGGDGYISDGHSTDESGRHYCEDAINNSPADNRTNSGYLNYRELAPPVIAYVKEMKYTHIELLPVMEHAHDGSMGYHVSGYYAPTARYGTADDLKFFINEAHRAGIGVILDWVPTHFPRDHYGLADFDGTCLYEHLDPRKKDHPYEGTLLFNYGRPQISNYLIANALYWVEQYHADGLRIEALESILYLDHGKQDGEWLANIYGGNENLEALEFIKHLNSMMKKRNPGVLMVAEEATAWPRLTGALDADGLGFDLKWNVGWRGDYLHYIVFDPYFRAHHHQRLTFSMIYAYSENFLLPLSHREVSGGKPGLIGQMPGEMNDWLANLRLTYAYQMMHPGKKLLFMGQDWGDPAGLDVNRAIDWTLQATDRHSKMKGLVRALNGLYRTHPALYALDDHPDGFQWINCIAADRCMLSFIRHSRKEEEMLVIVANFANIKQEFTVGVPREGRYNEIFNTDAPEFGGSGRVNEKEKPTEETEADGLPYSFTMSSAPLSLSVFGFTPLSAAEQAKRNKKKAQLINARLRQEKEQANRRRAAEKEAAEQREAQEKSAAAQRAAEETAEAERRAPAAKIAAAEQEAAEKAAATERAAAEAAAAEERARAEKEAAERRALAEMAEAERKAAAELERLKINQP